MNLQIDHSVVPIVKIYVLRLSREAYLDLYHHISEKYPLEACGILLGKIENGIAIVTRILPLRNIKESRTEFWIDEKEWIEKILEAQKQGLEYIGLYHSHPDAEPLPSPSDRHKMLECPGEVWLIVGYSPSGINMAAYRVGDDGYSLLSLRVQKSI